MTGDTAPRMYDGTTDARFDPDGGGHDFRRTIPDDGEWCQLCGLPAARWAGEYCPGLGPDTLARIEAVFVARYASRRELVEENDRLRRSPTMVADLLALALEIDHPDHYPNEEREETCRTCHGWTGLRATWPCSYHDHAEAIRRIARPERTT